MLKTGQEIKDLKVEIVPKGSFFVVLKAKAEKKKYTGIGSFLCYVKTKA